MWSSAHSDHPLWNCGRCWVFGREEPEKENAECRQWPMTCLENSLKFHRDHWQSKRRDKRPRRPFCLRRAYTGNGALRVEHETFTQNASPWAGSLSSQEPFLLRRTACLSQFTLFSSSLPCPHLVSRQWETSCHPQHRRHSQASPPRLQASGRTVLYTRGYPHPPLDRLLI